MFGGAGAGVDSTPQRNANESETRQKVRQSLGPAGDESAATSSEWDDEQNNYRVRSGETWGDRYDIQQVLGRGSFGQVVRAWDRHTQEPVAIKIIKNKRAFFNQAQIEIRLLELMQSVDAPERMYVIEFRNQFVWREHLCIAFELLSFNLYDLLKNTGFQGVSLILVRKFGHQVSPLICGEKKEI